MKWKYKYKLLRLLVRIERIVKSKKRKVEFDSDQQKKAINITERLIRDPKSELLMAPLSDKLYIKNKNLFVVIRPKAINIINGKYNYDVPIFDKLHNEISFKFKQKLEAKRREMEDIITGKVETILDVIYKDIEK